jgi:hypothetical protein
MAVPYPGPSPAYTRAHTRAHTPTPVPLTLEAGPSCRSSPAPRRSPTEGRLATFGGAALRCGDSAAESSGHGSYASWRAAQDRRVRRRRHRRLGGAAGVSSPPARASSSSVPHGVVGQGRSRARSTHRHPTGLSALRPMRNPCGPGCDADHRDLGRAHDARRATPRPQSGERDVGPPAGRKRIVALRPAPIPLLTSSSMQTASRAFLPRSSTMSSRRAGPASRSTSWLNTSETPSDGK